MTAKRDSKSMPKSDRRPKPDQRAIRDLEAREEADSVTGGDLLSNVSKTRSEISMTFARNMRA